MILMELSKNKILEFRKSGPFWVYLMDRSANISILFLLQRGPFLLKQWQNHVFDWWVSDLLAIAQNIFQSFQFYPKYYDRSHPQPINFHWIQHSQILLLKWLLLKILPISQFYGSFQWTRIVQQSNLWRGKRPHGELRRFRSISSCIWHIYLYS